MMGCIFFLYFHGLKTTKLSMDLKSETEGNFYFFPDIIFKY